MNPSWTGMICNLALDLARDDDPQRIIQSTLATLSTFFDADLTALWVYDPQQQTLRLHTTSRELDERVAGWEMPVGAVGPSSANLLQQRMFITEHFFEWLLTEPAVVESIHGMDPGEYAVLLGAKKSDGELLERSLLGVPVWANNKLTGLLGVLAARLDIPREELAEISRILGEIVGISLDRATAFSEVSQDSHENSLVRLMARQRMLSTANLHAQEEVRRQLAEDLHDTTNEIASAISMGLASLSMMLEGNATSEQAACIARLQDLSQLLAREQKALLDDLDPIALRTHGIGVALRARARRESDAAGLELRFEERGTQKRLIHDVELALYRIACEAIANIVEHAQAHSMEVSIAWGDVSLVVEVRDDGCGFDAADADALPEVEDNDDMLFGFHRGLGNMRNRAYAAGINLDIASKPGAGTCVRMEVPLTWQVLR